MSKILPKCLTEYLWVFSTLENIVNCKSNGWANGLRSLTRCGCEKSGHEYYQEKAAAWKSESHHGSTDGCMAAKYLSGEVRWTTGCADSSAATLSYAHLDSELCNMDSELSTSGLWVMYIWTLSYAHLDSVLCSSGLWAMQSGLWTMQYGLWTMQIWILNYAHLDSELCTSELLAMHIWVAPITLSFLSCSISFHLVFFFISLSLPLEMCYYSNVTYIFRSLIYLLLHYQYIFNILIIS